VQEQLYWFRSKLYLQHWLKTDAQGGEQAGQAYETISWNNSVSLWESKLKLIYEVQDSMTKELQSQNQQ